MSLVEQKKRIRELMRRQRQSLTPEQLMEAGRDLTAQLNSLLLDDDYPAALYLSFDQELSTTHFIESAWLSNRDIYLPIVLQKDSALRFRQFQENTVLNTNIYGINEPEEGPLLTAAEMKTICVPLTAFDRHGGRLGMGGGYYDRTLAELKQQPEAELPKLIGLGYEFQELEICPREAHDQPLDWVVTPKQTISIK